MDVRMLTSVVMITLFPGESLGGSNEKRLLHYLFKEKYYNALERPVDNESLPIVVNFTMILQQIIDVDEKAQIINTNIWLQMKWMAANLRWDPYEFGDIKSIRVPASKIWTPDVLLYNSADEKFDGTFHTNIVVGHDGNCLWVPPGMFKSTCAINIRWFPFDDQMCDMKFGAWSHDGRLLDLRMENTTGGDISSFIRNGEWELMGLPGRRNVRSYECCPEVYIDIVYTIHIRRRTLYYGFNIIIPCLLISAMSLLLFLLPPDAGEKISLGVTILLSLMVFLLLVAETMPPTSDAVPLIGVYFCLIMVMCSVSLCFTVIVLNFHYRGPETHIMPSWVRTGVNVRVASILRMKRPGREKRRQNFLQRQRLGDVQMHERNVHSFLPNLLETEDDFRPYTENGGVCGVGGHADDWIRPPSSPAMSYSQAQSSNLADETAKLLDNSGNMSGKGDLACILREIRKITAKVRREEVEADLKNEWKFAALVIDRLCLWICTAATVISTFAILMSAPHLFA